MGFYYAPGTKQNIKSHLRQWFRFCTRFKQIPAPASRDSLLAFSKLLALTSSYGHIKNIFSSLKFLHLALGKEFPEDDFQVTTVLHSLKRELGNKPYQVLPITPEILTDIYKFIDIEKPADLALWCSYLTAFYCLLRKSSAAPTSLAKFDTKKGLTRKKIKVLTDKNIALVLIDFSKTNQFGKREIIIPMVGNRVKALDPVFHLKKLFGSFSIAEDLPAFSWKEGNSLKTVTYTSFTTRLKTLLTRAGHRAKDYAGHSLRRGGASHLHRLGADSLTIQASGGRGLSIQKYFKQITFPQTGRQIVS